MSMLVIDLETNGYEPSVIWLAGVLDFDTDEFTPHVGDDAVVDAIVKMKEADCLIGHNIKAYDLYHIERLLDFEVRFDQNLIVDTLELSRELFPHFRSHSLEAWGERLGLPKANYTKGFSRFHPEMIPYCERDVRLNRLLFEHLLEHM